MPNSCRILIWSAPPWHKRSYSKTALNIAKRLRQAGHEVTWFAFTGLKWGEVEYDGFRVLPNGIEDYGQSWIRLWAQHTNADVIIQHFDAWVMGTDPLGMADLPIVWMPPVDHTPLPVPLKTALEKATHIVAITRFAEESFAAADLKSTYIPHGVDIDIYYPGDKKAARAKVELPQDSFILGVVAANKGPRKNLGNTLKAFAAFLEQVPEAKQDSMLFLNTYVQHDEMNPTGYNLPAIWKGLGISQYIKCAVPSYYAAIGFTEEEMANLYRAFDWLVSCPLGEGFNLPAIEALACETPVIFSNFSATPEVIGPGGLPVEPAEYMPFELSSAWQAIPSTKQITERMVEAYRDWKNGGELARTLAGKGRQHVLQNYEWSGVMPDWLKYIDDIAGKSKLKRREGIQVGMERPREIKRTRQ